ncbi:unnamed protein product [Hapterophycus canaliculatus]
MGRAAAAGTGLLANVVAGVGTAIGASRTGTDGYSTYGGGSGNGGGGGGGGSSGDDAARTRTSGAGDNGGMETTGGAPMLQLYRRADTADGETERATGGRVAPPNTSSSSGVRHGSSARGAEIGSHRGSRGTPAGATAEVAVGEVPSPRTFGSVDNTNPHGGRRGGDLTGDAAGGGYSGGTERRSALGVASATGGAVLRGLWGGVQLAAAAGVAVAAQSSSGGENGGAAAAGTGGGREAGPTPAFRLYRRDGDGSS